jgi:hypothetical protein
MSQILDEGRVFAQCLDLTSDQMENSRIMEELIEKERFSQAREYAILQGISSDKVSIMQVCLCIKWVIE